MENDNTLYRFVDVRFTLYDNLTVEFTRGRQHKTLHHHLYRTPTPASMDRLQRVLARQARCMGHVEYRWAERHDEPETTPQGIGVQYVVTQ